MIDTQALVWVGLNDRRLSAAAAAAIDDVDVDIFISAVTAYEFVELNRRGRFGADLRFDDIVDALAAAVLDLPATCGPLAAMLPSLHRDPIDRLVVAHAIHADLTLVTADATMRAYPVRTLW